MSYSKIVGRSKKGQDTTKKNHEERYNRTSHLQTGDRTSFSSHFFQQPCTQETSKTRILRPPVPRLGGLKDFSKTSPYFDRPVVTKKLETVEEKKNRLKSQLSKFESPFNWRPKQEKPLNDPEIILRRMQEKDREVKDERKLKWRNLIFHLVICYELWRAKKISQALEEVRWLESTLMSPSNRLDFMFACVEDAFSHVLNASKAFLYLEQDNATQEEDQDVVTKVEQLIEGILPCHMMNRQNQAGIHGIKAAVFMEYGHRGNKYALEEAMKAVELDRATAEWHFYVSKCLGRLRRVAQCHELPDPEEVRAVNKAIKLDQGNATYKVFLAQVLSERALREYKRDHPKRNTEQYLRIAKTNKAALHKFKEAVELNPNNPHVLIRCARGLMKLPPHLKDLKFTKDCIDKALALAPNNPMVHHVQAMYHERFDCDAELSLQEYDKAASLDNFGAAMDLVRLHHKLKTSDVVEELEILANKFEQTDKLQVIYTQAGSYLLFIKKDIIGALKYFLKVIDINPMSYAMMSHKPIFFRLKDPVNMFDVLLEELATKTDWNSFSPEEREVLKTFRIRVAEHEPVPREKKKRLTVEEILIISRTTTESDDIYKERRAARRWKNLQKKTRPERKWCGKKKQPKKNNSQPKKNSTKVSGKNEIKPLKEGPTTKNCKPFVKTNRRDSSISSINSVDSDYQRDSTLYGPRDFFVHGSNESLNSAQGGKLHSAKPYYSIDQTRYSSAPVGFQSHSNRSSRASSISSLSSNCSNVDFNQHTHPEQKNKVKSQLTVENMKKYDEETSHYLGIRRLSKLSLSSASSVSQASSTSSLSVMDRVKQSYAMLGRNNEPKQGKKKQFNKYGSTQSLNTESSANNKKGLQNKNITRSGSSQSVNLSEENQRNELSFNFKSRFTSQDSVTDNTRSSSFMPNFAKK